MLPGEKTDGCCVAVNRLSIEVSGSAGPIADGLGFLHCHGLSLFFTVLLLLTNITGCSTLPDSAVTTPSHTITNTDNTRLGLAVTPDLKVHPAQSGFYPLGTGLEAFLARIALIEVADKSLDVQYYIWKADETGLIVMQRILAAADRGVRVRLLLDDLDTAGKDLAIQLLDTHPNIEIRLFNPFTYRKLRALDFLTGLRRVNRRMHNKSLTADNQATIVGGRNIGNEYFDAVGDTVFADLDVLSVGPVVNEVSTAFDRYWNSDWAVPADTFATEEIDSKALDDLRHRLQVYIDDHTDSDYVQALKQTALGQNLQNGDLNFSWGEAELIYDAPEKVETEQISVTTHVGPHLFSIVDRAEDELIIVSPYFVPGKALVAYFGELVKRGVRVRILTNALAATDVSVVHAGYMRYREDLLRNGVELYEFKPLPVQMEYERKGSGIGSSGSSSLHAKLFGIDRQELFVGSFNLDPRSVSLNTEMGVWFTNEELGRLLGERFDVEVDQVAYRLSLEGRDLRWHALEAGGAVSFEHEPETTWWRRFTTWMLSLVVVESML